jgi:hypothetical protein
MIMKLNSVILFFGKIGGNRWHICQCGFNHFICQNIKRLLVITVGIGTAANGTKRRTGIRAGGSPPQLTLLLLPVQQLPHRQPP